MHVARIPVLKNEWEFQGSPNSKCYSYLLFIHSFMTRTISFGYSRCQVMGTGLYIKADYVGVVNQCLLVCSCMLSFKDLCMGTLYIFVKVEHQTTIIQFHFKNPSLPLCVGWLAVRYIYSFLPTPVVCKSFDAFSYGIWLRSSTQSKDNEFTIISM